MSTHYIRYHRASIDNSICSTSRAFEAWAEFRAKTPNWKPPVAPGDVVWVLSGEERKAGGKTYKLAYYFEAADFPQREENRLYIRGQKGAFLEQNGFIHSQPWFDEFFKSIGRGGISFQKIQSDYLPYFIELYKQKNIDDRLTALFEEPESEAITDAVTLQNIRTRRGQAEFRRRLLEAYGSRCAITGCTIEDILEGAHIAPHREGSNYETNNGLLLRTDIHTLFDLHLIGIDEYSRVVIAKQLDKTEYVKFRGSRLTAPDKLGDRPSELGLARRLKKLKELEAGNRGS